MDRTCPLQRGREISTRTQIQKKLPLSTSASLVLQSTTPIASHKSSATPLLKKLIGMMCTCTHRNTMFKAMSWTGIAVSSFWRTTRCLSKLHSSLAKILSTSSELSSTKSTMWSLALRTLKLFLDHQRGLKVLIIPSVFKTRFVRNFATIVYSWETLSFFTASLLPSLSFRDNLRRCFVRFSILSISVSQTPNKKTPLALLVTLLP